MAVRSEFENRKREVRQALLGRVAFRLFTRKTTGLDGVVKRQLSKRAKSVEQDPEILRMAQEMREQAGQID